MARTAGSVPTSQVAKALSVHLAFPEKRAKFGSPGRFLLFIRPQDLGKYLDSDALILNIPIIRLSSLLLEGLAKIVCILVPAC